MANLQVKDIDDSLYDSLRKRAVNDKRSISQEVVMILQKYLSLPHSYDRNPTEDFLGLSGDWIEEKDAGEIIGELRKERVNSRRDEVLNELFD